MEDKIAYVLNSVKNKDEVKATTTLQFKKDISEILFSNSFDGNILEIGTSGGNTTVILCCVAEILGKHVYSFEYDPNSIEKARALCSGYGFMNVDIVQKDVYGSEWDDIVVFEDIGCVFIDCVHTEECFAQDLMNAEKIAGKDAIIIAHDYGLVTKDGKSIKKFLDKNKDKYEIVRYMGEQDNWNELGSGKVIDWEGVQLKIIE